VEHVLGRIPGLVKPFIGGKVDVTGRLMNAAGHEIICFKVTIEIKSG
jgi:hypothetical protein